MEGPTMLQTAALECCEGEALPQMGRLFARAHRLTRNWQDAAQLVQETYLRPSRAFDGYTPGSNVPAWLCTIADRSRTDAFRKKQRSPRTVELTREPPAAPRLDEEADPSLVRR